MIAPAYLIVTDHLRVRCWAPGDAPLLQSAVLESLEHLRPSMPWAQHEPRTLGSRVDLLRGFRARMDRGEDAIYGIFDPREERVLGGAGLHRRGEAGAREIGYWIHAAHVRHGYATEVAGALTRVAFEHERVERVEIHCGPGNVASARVAARLGYTHEATLRRRFDTGKPGAPRRDTMIWSIFDDDYPSSPAAKVPVEAFDAAGARLL